VLLLLSQQGGTCPLSEIRVTTVSDTAGTGPVTLTKQSASKMWVNQDNGTTINQGLNVSSLTDNGTGDYTHNFTNNFANVHYAGSGIVNTGSNYSNLIINKYDQHLVGSVQVFIGNVTNSNPERFTKFDGADVMYSICGDLA